MPLEKRPTAIATIVTLALTVALVSPAISPASANGVMQSLPAVGDSLFAMASSGTGKGFGSIDVSTGAAIGLATARATTPFYGDIFTGGAYDPNTGTAYVINEINGNNQTLQSVDPVTGVLTTVAIMWAGTSTSYKYVRSIAIADDGTAYAIVDNHVLYSLNLTTGELALIADTELGDLPSLAVNPIDDLLYAVDGNNEVFTLNTTTGTPTSVGTFWSTMCGFQFDRAGVAWFNVCGGDLYSATDLTDFAASFYFQGAITIDAVTPQMWSILYVPAAEAPTAPTAPRSVATGTATATSVPLSWTVPLSLYGRAVTDYVIQYKVTEASSWSTFTDGVGASTAATVTGLTPVTSYQFQVSAVTSAGSSEYSAPVTTTTLAAGPSGITSAPLSLKVGKKAATSRALSWKAPVTLNGGSITDYIIQYRVGGTTEWSTFTDSVSVSKAGKVTGLTKKRKYQFQVAARTSAGTSPYSVATKAS